MKKKNSFLLMLVVGSLFTFVKYNVILDQGLTVQQLLDKLIIIFTIIGLLILFFILFFYLGKRRLDKELED
jgi:hypothetical protein